MDTADLERRVQADIADGDDEELELELEDWSALPGGGIAPSTSEAHAQRQRYFRELLRPQGELVKLQEFFRTVPDLVPCQEVPHPPVVLPERVRHPDYARRPVPPDYFVPDVF